jgi:hypothetical protein
MSGRERNGFVVEEQVCVLMRLPLGLPAAAELELADDPELAGMEAHDLVPLVQPPTIAGPGATQRNRHDVAGRCHPVALRHWSTFRSRCFDGRGAASASVLFGPPCCLGHRAAAAPVLLGRQRASRAAADAQAIDGRSRAPDVRGEDGFDPEDAQDLKRAPPAGIEPATKRLEGC